MSQSASQPLEKELKGGMKYYNGKTLLSNCCFGIMFSYSIWACHYKKGCVQK